MTDYESAADGDRMGNRNAKKHVRLVSLWVNAMSASPRGYRVDVLMEAPVNKRSPIRSIAVPDKLKAHQIGPRVITRITRSPTSRA